MGKQGCGVKEPSRKDGCRDEFTRFIDYFVKKV
jgi:hypothetical protein